MCWKYFTSPLATTVKYFLHDHQRGPLTYIQVQTSGKVIKNPPFSNLSLIFWSNLKKPSDDWKSHPHQEGKCTCCSDQWWAHDFIQFFGVCVCVCIWVSAVIRGTSLSLHLVCTSTGPASRPPIYRTIPLIFADVEFGFTGLCLSTGSKN